MYSIYGGAIFKNEHKLEFLVTLIVKSDGYLLLIIAIFFHMFRALCFFKYYTIAIELKSKVKMQYVESKYILCYNFI